MLLISRTATERTRKPVRVMQTGFNLHLIFSNPLKSADTERRPLAANSETWLKTNPGFLCLGPEGALVVAQVKRLIALLNNDLGSNLPHIPFQPSVID